MKATHTIVLVRPTCHGGIDNTLKPVINDRNCHLRYGRDEEEAVAEEDLEPLDKDIKNNFSQYDIRVA